MKIISVDYDDTYSADPALFSQIIKLMQAAGHLVVMVTARSKDNPVPNVGIEVFYTDGEKKAPFMLASGLLPDIWMDDRPDFIGDVRNALAPRMGYA